MLRIKEKNGKFCIQKRIIIFWVDVKCYDSPNKAKWKIKELEA